MSGYLLKRSQYWKNWEKRYIVINKDGLFSYRNLTEPPSFVIFARDAKYLWTRFSIVEDCLIVKIKHGWSQTEFALPIINFSIAQPGNWLLALYSLIMAKYL